MNEEHMNEGDSYFSTVLDSYGPVKDFGLEKQQVND